MKDAFSGILGILMAIYVIVSQIMCLVFWIQYIQAGDSIIEIIFVDIVLSEIKGILWIFFI